MNLISSTVKSCLDGFRLLSADLDIDQSLNSLLPGVSNQLARFKVWAGNIGAHLTGRSSLEYRLRDSSSIRNQVVKLLDNIRDSLKDGKNNKHTLYFVKGALQKNLANWTNQAHSILRGEMLPEGERQEGETDNDSSDGDSGSQAPESDGSGEEITDSMELDQILADIIECLDCLFRLSVSIRNPAPHDRFRQSKETDTSTYEHYDIQYVGEKCPQAADERILERLGKANSLRRQYFKYRKRHHEKLSSGLEGEKTDDGKTSTVASSLPQNLKEPDDTQGVNDQDEISDSGRTETSYGSRVAADGVMMPPLPPLAAAGPFECPFCYLIVSTPTTRSWRYGKSTCLNLGRY